MKCPKCGYVSFDYNQICPKCNKDVSEERNRLNLPDYEPSTPFLIGALTGGLDESPMDMGIGAAQESAATSPEDVFSTGEEAIASGGDESSSQDELDISLDGGFASDEMAEEPSLSEDVTDLPTKEALGDEESVVDEDISDMDFELESTEGVLEEGETAAPSSTAMGAGTDEEITFDLDESGQEEGAAGEPSVEDLSIDEEEDLSLDLEELASEESIDIGPLTDDEAGPSEEDLSIDLEDLNLDEDELEESMTPEDSSAPGNQESDIDLDSISLDEYEASSIKEEVSTDTEGEEEVILELEDLKVNETGELEIGASKTKSSEEEVASLETDGTEPGGPSVEPSTDAAEDAETDEDSELMMELDGLLLDDESEDFKETSEEELPAELDDLELELDLEGEPEEK